jgi:hypothetical protein
MSNSLDIRSVILKVIDELYSKDNSSPQSTVVLQETIKQLGEQSDQKLQQAILTQYGELFRTGYLAWGLNFANPSPPFFHITEQGRSALSDFSRDPSNPAGYLANIDKIYKLNPVSKSYLDEALQCFVQNLYKSSAVMIGAAAESELLELRDILKDKLDSLRIKLPGNIDDWRIKTVLGAMGTYFDQEKSKFDRSLKEEYEGYWPAFNQFIRSSRNDAGHPISVDPISYDIAHANLLIFPKQMQIISQLKAWINKLS